MKKTVKLNIEWANDEIFGMLSDLEIINIIINDFNEINDKYGNVIKLLKIDCLCENGGWPYIDVEANYDYILNEYFYGEVELLNECLI